MCETRRFYLWLLQVVILLGLLALFLWLGLRPNEPTYTIVDFAVPPLNNQNTTSPPPNTTASFMLQIDNSNKDSSIYYDYINMTIYYGDDTLWETILPSFEQDKGSKYKIGEHFNMDNRIWKAVFRAVSNGTAEMRMGLISAFKYKTLAWKSKHHRVHLQGHVPIGSNGKISGKKKHIKLHHASSIKKKLRVI